MSAALEQDVPSPVDLRKPSDAKQWEQEALQKRPWRTEFFEQFAQEIRPSDLHSIHVLELGSGPGFLALHILNALPKLNYTLLDFSPAMHTLAQSRLQNFASQTVFVERNFRQPDWIEGLGKFDFVLTNQAVHELRHKRHAVAFHRDVKQLLKPNGTYLVCDHFVGEDGMKNDQLYMTIEEQRNALIAAGFKVEQRLKKGGLVLHHAVLS